MLESVDTCKHPNLPMPAFDEKAAANLTPNEVRTRFPRGYDTCPDCGIKVIMYASYMHYISGDW